MDIELINDTKNALLDIAECLYQGYVSNGIGAMAGVIPNLSVVAANISDEGMQQKLINDALMPILAAMEDKDGTLLADLITYELVEILDTL